MGIITSAILAATAIASTVNSAVQQRKAAKSQKKQTEASNRINERRAQREKIDQMRQARIAAGQVANVGGATGIGGSSGVQGQVSSVGAQLGSNVAFIDSNMGDARESAFWGNKAAGYQSKAATSGAVAGIAGAAFTQFGGAGDLTKAFSGSTPPPPLPPMSNYVNLPQFQP